jgi:hypothetical protein
MPDVSPLTAERLGLHDWPVNRNGKVSVPDDYYIYLLSRKGVVSDD